MCDGAQVAASREQTRSDTGLSGSKWQPRSSSRMLFEKHSCGEEVRGFTVNWLHLRSFVMLRTICKSEVGYEAPFSLAQCQLQPVVIATIRVGIRLSRSPVHIPQIKPNTEFNQRRYEFRKTT